MWELASFGVEKEEGEEGEEKRGPMRDGTQIFESWARSFALDVDNVVFHFIFLVVFGGVGWSGEMGRWVSGRFAIGDKVVVTK